MKADMNSRSIKSLILTVIISSTVWAASSEVTTFSYKKVWGKGPLPYNYRIIDKKIHAGGHPFNPGTSFGNSDRQTLSILKYLKSQGVKTVIDLQNSQWIAKRYRKLLRKAGIIRIHIPMHASKVPTQKEWQRIKKAMKKPVYIHCKWGADRTGAIIGRYLVEEKEYPSKEAYLAVITGGSHAGPIGGLKKGRLYRNLARFIWPDHQGSKL
jgi:protein-tyrosine phosphatase